MRIVPAAACRQQIRGRIDAGEPEHQPFEPAQDRREEGSVSAKHPEQECPEKRSYGRNRCDKQRELKKLVGFHRAQNIPAPQRSPGNVR